MAADGGNLLRNVHSHGYGRPQGSIMIGTVEVVNEDSKSVLWGTGSAAVLPDPERVFGLQDVRL